jgi:chemosensory pili system protein ChpC
MSEPTELYSLLIPLRSERLLVPRMCVAEVIPFTDTDREDIAGAPSWLIGSVDWNGRRLPVVSFDTAQSAESVIARRRGNRSRVVVFHAISDQMKLRHYGVLTQGFPQLVRVNRDVITLDPEGEVPDGQPILCRVRMIHEFPLIPDLEAIEEKLGALEAGLIN